MGLDERAGLVVACLALEAGTVEVRVEGRGLGLSLLEAGVKGAVG